MKIILLFLVLYFLTSCIRPTTWSGDVYQCPAELLQSVNNTLTEVKNQCQQQAMK